VLTSDNATIHERFDLKGSWIHRHHKPPAVGQRVACRFCGQDFRVGTRRVRNQCPLRPNHQHEPNTILLDNDWDYKLRLARPQARALVTAVIADTEWLRDQGIMDYSLLLGIHRSRYNLMSLGGDGGGLAPAAGGGAVISEAAVKSPAPTVPVPRAPLSIRTPAARYPDCSLLTLGSPLTLASSFQSSAPQSFSSSFALSADSAGGGGGGGGGSGGSGTPAAAPDGPQTAATILSPATDERNGSAGPLFFEVEEAPARAPGAALQPPSLFHDHRGGMRAVVVEGPGIYYLGMIDVLQRWTLGKRLENWFKTRVLLQDVSGISAVPPRLYAARFKARVLAQLIEGWDEERES
jgi:1-phosphatidylinositol-4-phosphate 5-kinase